MSDDKTKGGSPDSKRINLNQYYEVESWCKKFKCTKKELRDAVKAVGDSVERVEEYFSKK